MTAVRSAFVCALGSGCADLPAPEAPCDAGAPCRATLRDGGAPGPFAVLPVNVLDRPLFEVFRADGEGGIHRVVTWDPERWPAGTRELDGDFPAALWDPATDVTRVCRHVDGEVRCAARAGEGPWTDQELVRVDDARLRPLHPLAMTLEQGAPVLYVAIEAEGLVGLYRATWDGARAWVPEEPPLFREQGAPVASAAFGGSSAEPFVRVRAGDVLVTLVSGAARWEERARAPSDSAWIASATFYGRDLFWEQP